MFCVHVEKVGRKGPPSDVLDLAKERGVPVRFEEGSFFAGQEGGGRRFALDAGPYPEIPLDDLVDAVRAETSPALVLVLDGIVDPRNFGALIRTALCAGVSGIVVPKDNSAPSSPAASRASAGALEHARVARVNNLVRALYILKEAGLWVYGAAADGDTALWEANLTGPAALCLGGEGKGLRRLVRETCDVLLSIPQEGPLDSLNASVAGALCMYEAFRQRRAAGRGA
jgi:23S rRNA (guanosine2251-2'-O)-methyltransferase